MIFIVFIASILIAAVTIYQYNEQAEDYHNMRLERKEEAIKAAITYELNRDTIKEFETILLPSILEKKLNEISDIHNLDINIYNLGGGLLRSSYVDDATDTTDTNLSKDIMKLIIFNPDHRMVVQKTAVDGNKFKSSYSYCLDLMTSP